MKPKKLKSSAREEGTVLSVAHYEIAAALQQ
jgi:hypothetical protein